jgi:hypothetical protein
MTVIPARNTNEAADIVKNAFVSACALKVLCIRLRGRNSQFKSCYYAVDIVVENGVICPTNPMPYSWYLHPVKDTYWFDLNP